MVRIGAQWFSQMLFVISLLLLLVRKVVLAVQKEERKSIQKESSVYVWMLVMFFLLWGASKLLNTPVVESYRFGIYTVAFLLGYYVFSQDIVIEVLNKITGGRYLGGGTTVIPLYIGQERIDEIVVRAARSQNFRSGGR